MNPDRTFYTALKKGLGFGLGIVLVIGGTIFAQTLNTFSSGDLISAAQVNANFNALKTRMDTLEQQITPVGGIIPWHKSLVGVPTIPAGWVECDGALITDTDSPMNGQNAPNLNAAPNAWNGGGYYLRGSTTSGATQVDIFQGHRHLRNPLNQTEHDMRPGGLPGGGNQMPAPGPGHPVSAHTTGDPTNGLNGAPRTGGETRPVSFTIVWIMRIK